MTNELRQCEDCKHSIPQPGTYLQCTHPKLGSVSCSTGRKTFCEISAVYFEPSEPSIEQISVMFDGLEDEQPKSKIETREVF